MWPPRWEQCKVRHPWLFCSRRLVCLFFVHALSIYSSVSLLLGGIYTVFIPYVRRPPWSPTHSMCRIPATPRCSPFSVCSAPGWHVCSSPAEVDTLSEAGTCSRAPFLFLTSATESLDSSCDSYGVQTVVGCGGGNTLPPDHTGCNSVRTGISGDSLSFPWAVRGSSFDLGRNIVKRTADAGGLMCCLDNRPSVSDIVPKTGPQEGGTRVTLTGIDLGTGPDDVTSITIGGSPCVDIEWISSAKIICTTTANNQSSSGVSTGTGGAAGDSSTTGNGGGFSYGSEVVVNTKSKGPGVGLDSGDFTYEDPALAVLASATGGLSISGIMPSLIAPNGGSVIYIKGTGFNNTDLEDITVLVAGVECTSLTLTPEGYLKCTTADITEALANGATAEVSVSINGKGTAASEETFELLQEGQKECPELCGFTSRCDVTVGECKCRAGWTGETCQKPAFIQSPLSGKWISEAGAEVTFTVRLSARPESNVNIRYVPSDEKEAFVSPPSLTFTGGNWDRERTITIRGLDDLVCDGEKVVALVREVTSKDPVFHQAPMTTNDPLVLRNKESNGRIINIAPETVGMSGDYVWIVAENVCHSPIFTVDGIEYKPIKRSRRLTPDSEKRRLQFAAATSRRLRMLSNETATTTVTAGGSTVTTTSGETLDVLLLPQGQEEFTVKLRNQTVAEGYRTLTLNADISSLAGGSNGEVGVAATSKEEAVFITAKCAEEGMFGTGASCRPCPEGAVCPGGSRAWPEEGYWTPDEESGVIQKCPRPESCLGGKDASCATGYEGALCGACIYGYYEQNSACIVCPSASDATWYIIADVILWCSFALCGIFITHQMLFSYIVMLVKSLQALAAIGEMGTEVLPDWLQTVYSVLHLFSGDYSFLKPDCYNPVTVEEKFYNSLTYNVIIFLPLLFGVPIAGVISRFVHKCRGTDAAQVQHTMDWYKDRTVRCFIIFLGTVYLPATTRAVAMLSCQDMGEAGHYMIIEPSHQCYTTTAYWNALAVACVVLVMLSVSFPLFMMNFLRVHKAQMFDNPRFGERFNFLYEFYKPGFTLFWAIEFAISCVIACANSILVPHPKYQLSICTIIFGMKFIFICWKGPFLDWITNSLQAVLTLALLLAVNANYLLTLDWTRKVTVLRQSLPIFIVVLSGATIFCILGLILWTATKKDKDEDEEEDVEGDDDLVKKYDIGFFAHSEDGVEDDEELVQVQDVETSMFTQLASFLPDTEHNMLRRRVSAFFSSVFDSSTGTASGSGTGSQDADDEIDPAHVQHELDVYETNILRTASQGQLQMPVEGEDGTLHIDPHKWEDQWGDHDGQVGDMPTLALDGDADAPDASAIDASAVTMDYGEAHPDIPFVSSAALHDALVDGEEEEDVHSEGSMGDMGYHNDY
eukprot:TRINITY_DN8938_c0_g3_i1.p1 TRINITY_DN8938_c0_g3~~TRINITY_DN8938_c0_g3_i1.p1  ORF type:complete len:1387 (+),score=389.60 TRINITY_DN8938_c0_g3_i1:331-4491(+)